MFGPHCVLYDMFTEDIQTCGDVIIILSSEQRKAIRSKLNYWHFSSYLCLEWHELQKDIH